MPSSPHVDQLEPFSDPSRFLRMEVTPPFLDKEQRFHFEDEFRRAARALNTEIIVVVMPRKDATQVFLIDLQPDLLGDSREKLLQMAHMALGVDDPAGPKVKGSVRQNRGSSRLRKALVSGSGDETTLHTLAYGNVTFIGERDVSKTRTVIDDTDVPSEHTIIGISRSPTLSLQLRPAAGSSRWASVKLKDFDLGSLNRTLEKYFNHVRIDIATVRDNTGGYEIQAAELVAALAKASDANASTAPTNGIGCGATLSITF